MQGLTEHLKVPYQKQGFVFVFGVALHSLHVSATFPEGLLCYLGWAFRGHSQVFKQIGSTCELAEFQGLVELLIAVLCDDFTWQERS